VQPVSAANGNPTRRRPRRREARKLRDTRVWTWCLPGALGRPRIVEPTSAPGKVRHPPEAL
jgi:hypothetical protein